MEVAGINLPAVLQSEQATGVEPRPVRLPARRVVLVGVAKRALALQVVLRRRHLADGCYHGGWFPNRWAIAIVAAGPSASYDHLWRHNTNDKSLYRRYVVRPRWSGQAAPGRSRTR